MRAYIPTAAACAALALAWDCAVPAVADSGPSTAFTITDPRITESSGLAASRLHPGIYWTHNDSGDGPYVYAVDSATGKTVARVTMRGIHPRDVEAVSIGPNGDLYLGDIGDNLGGAWREVWIYRFHEPAKLSDQTVDVTRYTVRYDAGPRDAEALMVQPRTGRVYIASKNEDGGGLYRGPAELSSHGINVFRKIADVPWVTDGAFSPDGSRLVLRGYFWAAEYRWTGGAPHKLTDLDVPMQPQGEGVTFTPDGKALMYSSEGKDSQVWRAPLSGSELPDSVTASPAATKGADGSQGGGKDQGGPGAAAQHSSSGSGVSSSDKTLGFGALVLVGALGLALRRIVRRRRA
ncbi:PD40 domain-containing protein [Actinacidiphila paucisporea]|uniref:MYXO-CTERM domain-containing protein n=1 Tax=Actinacidiphila paucisporea TaxID=310782 RepID=A0A1M7EN78_9ACTN|nr:PD40 domain-containing protein [Actinacidiphila paucisporea]SHL93046.1 MYXO-CTERM domain-containing protein [Actinacidiphila paucisporea]